MSFIFIYSTISFLSAKYNFLGFKNIFIFCYVGIAIDIAKGDYEHIEINLNLSYISVKFYLLKLLILSLNF